MMFKLEEEGSWSRKWQCKTELTVQDLKYKFLAEEQPCSVCGTTHLPTRCFTQRGQSYAATDYIQSN